MSTLERCKKALATVCGVEAATIPDDATLQSYLDSAAALEFLLALEDEFAIAMPDDATSAASKLQEVVVLIDQLVQRKNATA